MVAIAFTTSMGVFFDGLLGMVYHQCVYWYKYTGISVAMSVTFKCVLASNSCLLNVC